MAGSYALISEGAHTLTDITTSIIAYIGFKIGSKPADEEHPLGHGRAEAIAGLLIVIFLVIVAYEIITGAIERLFFGGTPAIPDPLAVVMAIIGVITHFSLSQYIINLGERANSPAIIADGKHQRVDIFASLAILFGILIAQYGYPQLDPFIGFVIGLLILKTAFDVARENLDNIMGKVPSPELVDRIVEVSNSVDKVCGTHNVRVNYLGSYATVTLHIELPPDMSLDESHKVVHLVQNKIIDEIDVIHGVTAHACPFGLEYDHDQQLDE
jgi:cation diffusion facilitator family transporter